MTFFRQTVLAAMLCALVRAATFGEEDIKYSDLPESSLGITVEYSTGQVSCPEQNPDERGEECAELSWDDDDWVFLTWSLTPASTLDNLTPTAAQVYRCFSAYSKTNRAWRKFKDIIRKDKQCKKIATVAADAPQEYNYTIPSDSAEATYWFRVLTKCGDGKHDFCAQDSNLGDYFAVEPMDSIPGGLVAGVVIAVIIAPTFLVLYFVYEFGFKKEK